jgi:hypothetical protein
MFKNGFLTIESCCHINEFPKKKNSFLNHSKQLGVTRLISIGDGDD